MRATRLALALATMVVMTGGCGSDSNGDGGGGPSDFGFLRVINAVTNASDVIVEVDNAEEVTGLAFGDGSEYFEVGAGAHSVEVHEENEITNLIQEQVDIVEDSSYTVIAAGGAGNLAGFVLEDDLSAPGSGMGKLRLGHFALGMEEVDVYITDASGEIDELEPALTELPYGMHTNYVDADPGVYRIVFATPGTKNVVLTTVNLTLAAGRIMSVFAIEGSGQLEFMRTFDN